MSWQRTLIKSKFDALSRDKQWEFLERAGFMEGRFDVAVEHILGEKHFDRRLPRFVKIFEDMENGVPKPEWDI